MNPTLYILLFTAALAITYLVVRLGWVQTSSALIVGSMLNSLCFFLYSTARENTFDHALMVGAALGIVFTSLSVSLAVLFREDWSKQGVAV